MQLITAFYCPAIVHGYLITIVWLDLYHLLNNLACPFLEENNDLEILVFQLYVSYIDNGFLDVFGKIENVKQPASLTYW